MIQPKGKHVIVRRDDNTVPPDVPDRFIKGGRIVIPDIAKALSREGKVLSVGPKVQEDIRKGDRVAITWMSGTKFDDVDDGPVEILLETEILAVLGR